MKDLMKKALEFCKKHLVTLIYCVIALCAVGAIFWPINGQYDELKDTMEKRKQLYDSLKQTLTKNRQTPLIPGGAEQAKLDGFPTKNVIAQWDAVTKQIQNDSKQMFDAAVEMNTRTPLTPNVLPDTSQTYPKVQFRREYKARMDLKDETNRKNLITNKLRAGFRPSDQAISEARNALEQKMLADAPKDPTTDKPSNPNFDADVTAAKLGLPDKMNAEVAQSCVIYVDPDALDPNPPEMLNLAAPAPPDPAQIYVAQVGYWIQQDVIDSIAAANKDAKNVKDAPVKHLWKIKFASNAFAPLMAGTPPPDAAGQSMEPASEWKTVYTNSPSGRESNGIYDVYRFGLRLFVDADCVGQVIRELTRGKLINVLTCDVISRDTTEYQTKGYYYGDRPIVQLDLQCEATLLRKWTSPLMPQSVRTALGVKLPEKTG